MASGSLWKAGVVATLMVLGMTTACFAADPATDAPACRAG